MKLTIFFALFLAVFVAYTQGQSCRQAPRQRNCLGGRDVGRVGHRCQPRNMWYYDASDRNCKQMPYRGCGGNNNRHCSPSDCERRCHRH